MYDVLIKKGTIIDGTGSPWFRADLTIRDGKIAKMGHIKGDADEVIDADGLTVSPGWVDFHSHSDWSLLRYPYADSDLIQGATLVVTGNCGSSAAPLTGQSAERAKARARDLEVEVNWSTFDEYLKRLEKQGVSMNVACLVGHGTIRSCVMGEKERRANEEELDKMKKLVGEAMRAGAFGMSTGLVFPPGCWSDTRELIELSKIVAEYDGIYASHIRGERETNIEATKELIEIGAKAGVRVHRSHMQSKHPVYGNAPEVLKLMEEARRQGVDVACDTEAFPWIGFNAVAQLPPWPRARLGHDFLDMLKDPETRAKLKKEMRQMDPYDPLGRTGQGGIYQTRAWDRAWIYECNSDPSVEGKKISEIAIERGLDPEDVLFDLIAAEHGKGPKLVVAYIEDDHKVTAPNRLCIFASTDGSVVETGRVPPRYFQYSPEWLGMFPRVLSRYVKEEGLMTAEEAIRRMTSFACQRLRIFDRGIIRVGMCADLTIFNLEAIQVRGDFENPQQRPEGIEHVLVNGQLAVKNGEYAKIQAGTVLRHGA